MTDQEKEVKELREKIDQQSDHIEELQDEAKELESELYHPRNADEQNPFYDIDDETLEDQRKTELLKDNWEYFTAQQLEVFLKIIGRNI